MGSVNVTRTQLKLLLKDECQLALEVRPDVIRLDPSKRCTFYYVFARLLKTFSNFRKIILKHATNEATPARMVGESKLSDSS